MSARPEPTEGDAALVAALGQSQRLGMLGGAPIADVIAHSDAFLVPLTATSGTAVDLGSGGGVPGLVVAWRRPDLRVILVDRRATRTDHLRRLVHRLGLGDRVDVLTTTAAALPRLLDDRVDAVTARSFGTPATVLSAAAPILAAGGPLIVSEPPAGQRPERWPNQLLASTGFVLERSPDRRVAVLRRLPRGTRR